MVGRKGRQPWLETCQWDRTCPTRNFCSNLLSVQETFYVKPPLSIISSRVAEGLLTIRLQRVPLHACAPPCTVQVTATAQHARELGVVRQRGSMTGVYNLMGERITNRGALETGSGDDYYQGWHDAGDDVRR